MIKSVNMRTIPDYISEYDPDWPLRFREIRTVLASVLPNRIIHHTGSTSIPGMFAKPIIDIIIQVPKGRMPETIERLEANGYRHNGDQGIPGREVFKPETQRTLELPEHHLYACEEDAPEIEKHIAFREYLKSHADEANKLAAYKQHLACEKSLSRAEYVETKPLYVTPLAARALTWYRTQHPAASLPNRPPG